MRRGRGRADQHPVAAGVVDLLDHQLGEVVQHVGPVLRLAQHPGRDVREQRLLAQVEPDHLRDVGVDGLVVRDAGADGVGDGDVAGAIGGEQPWHAQHRVRPERQRVEEVVVDSPVHDVDALRAPSRAHVQHVVAHEEVLPFDELDPHLLGEEGVLEVGAVVVPGVSRTTVGSETPLGATLFRFSSSTSGYCSTGAMGCSQNSSGNRRIIILRFSSMYETPEGTRRLSSSTQKLPPPSRTMSMPAMWA